MTLDTRRSARKQKKGSFLASRGTHIHHVGPAQIISPSVLYASCISLTSGLPGPRSRLHSRSCHKENDETSLFALDSWTNRRRVSLTTNATNSTWQTDRATDRRGRFRDLGRRTAECQLCRIIHLLLIYDVMVMVYFRLDPLIFLLRCILSLEHSKL